MIECKHLACQISKVAYDAAGALRELRAVSALTLALSNIEGKMGLGVVTPSAVALAEGKSSALLADGCVLHHYTDAGTALKILQERTIWLAAPWHLNDPREGAGFLDLLADYGVANPLSELAIRKACDLLKNHLFYVACFSEDGDLLSQWRAYAKDAQGVSIGFDRSVLHDCLARQSFLVERPVEYVDTVEGLDPDGEAYQALRTLSSHHGDPNSGYLQTLSKVRYAVKRRAYREEREARLIFTPDSHPLSATELPSKEATYDRRYFGTLCEIRDYYALTFAESIWPSLVRCVTFGPKNRTNRDVACDMLKRHGLANTLVRYSNAHYQ